MNKVLRIILLSFIIAFVNYGLTFVGPVNVILAVSLGFLLIDDDSSSVIFTILCGIFFDLMFHSNVGLMSISILIPLIFFVLVKSFNILNRSWQKLIFSYAIIYLSYIVHYLIGKVLFEGLSMNKNLFLYYAQVSVGSWILTGIAYLVLYLIKERIDNRPVVKV
ncbi:hypothetical protein JW887_05755 [Candidatus Dojkabacteria bacterium]|nr:hypothetical protein [Candidatus Dojkabacteria bacterium]